MSAEKPPHPAVEGPESQLEDVREQAHEPAGLTERVAALEEREKALVAEIAAREKREVELRETLVRLQADFDNHRRRTREEASQATSRGRGDLLRDLLPVLDNLDRAIAHAEDEGLRLLAKQLHSTLANVGLIVIDPAGEVFDARVHEAIGQEEREGAEKGTVVTVLEKGYSLDGRVLRPARVIVAA